MNLSTINSHLSERRVAVLSAAVATLEAGIIVGSVRNVDFNDAKDVVSRAVEEAAEAFLATGPHAANHPQSDWWLGAYKCDAFVHGAWNVPSALKRAQKAEGLKEYAEFLAAALLPLAEQLQAAKPLIVKRQDQPKVMTPKKAAQLAKSMTCQCCGRQIFAEVGMIAHHGYQRPGGGWQTASCMGARELPFEVSRDCLGRLIVSLETWKVRAIAHLAKVRAETAPVVMNISDFSQPYNAAGRRPTVTLEVTRANFEEFRAAHPKAILLPDFEAAKAREIKSQEREIANIIQEIAAQQARFDGWKLTHEWTGTTWRAK